MTKWTKTHAEFPALAKIDISKVNSWSEKPISNLQDNPDEVVYLLAK